MKLNVYSLHDLKALNYNQPFFALTDGAAVRIIQDVANDLSTSIGRHPADFVLFCIGTYDDSLGLMIPETPLRHVLDVIALVHSKQPQAGLFEETALNGKA